PENLANKLRQKLGISIQTQINWKNEYMAFYQWKEILEQTGIFIFQFSMP
ncbi:zinc peptidase, partial [Candidatus Beckwithbacteria bacterium CG22_combo_CG10-13_8_21_14_all_01_47_9]